MSGRLVAPGGAAFSYVTTFFRYVEPNGVAIYPAVSSVVDEANGRLFSERRTERAGLGLADASAGRLDVRVARWRLSETMTGAATTFALDVNVEGVALHVRGVARKARFVLRSATVESDQYSRLASVGTIAVGGRRLEVGGTSWLEHELSNADPNAVAAHSQFRVQLDDGREIYVEDSSSNERRRAYLIERNGTVVTLAKTSYEFDEHPGSTWLSPHSRRLYPDTWGLHVDDKTEFLSLEPVAYDQESVAHGDGLSYWDGAVDIYDVTPGSQGLRLGSGYVLMNGSSAGHAKR